MSDALEFDWNVNKMKTQDNENEMDASLKPMIWIKNMNLSHEKLTTHFISERKMSNSLSESVRDISPNIRSFLLAPDIIKQPDPSKIKLSPDDLQLKPFYFKAKKSHIDQDQKDSKYWKKREKNNIAARKSRVSRRIKDNQVTLRARYLEEENDALKCKLEKLEKENTELQEKVKFLETKILPIEINSLDFESLVDSIDDFL